MTQPGIDEPGSGTGTVLEHEVATTPRTSHGDGDHERFAHYAPKDKIMEAMVTGTPVTALCGKVWVPSRDPQRFPVCPTCKEIFDGLPPGKGDDEG
jgi:Protein of unknown function (DUF3039)